MKDEERSRIEALLDQDAELRQLWEEHRDLDQRIAEFDLRRYLTPPEQNERKQLQKLKLAGKDRIARILSKHGVR
jgi:uncharacterized protein YdcH (DUF465 family)